MKYYKKARPDGWDFFTGKTINYRENIGKTITVPNYQKGRTPSLCTDTVIHASWDPNCFVGAKIPCSVFVVSGKAVVKDVEKAGFRKLKIIEEIPESDFDKLFGWRYSEAINPINPLKISIPKIGEQQIALLKNWVSVEASVWNSVWNSVMTSVGDSVMASVWTSVEASVMTSVEASVRDSFWTSVRASIMTSVSAYIGSFFPNIKKWLYVTYQKGTYPFQSCVDLWKMGLVPSFDGVMWRLHGGSNARVLFSKEMKDMEFNLKCIKATKSHKK